jgi:uncharacterized protein YvpB
MYLDYLDKANMTKVESKLEEETIAEIMDTGPSGTRWPEIPNINSAIESNPSLEFIPEYGPHSLSDIKKQLEKNLPVIVWIAPIDAAYAGLHSILITGIDDEKKEISYNDPAYGEEKTLSQSEFMDLWQYEHGARMIKVEIGELTTKTQSSLEPFMSKEVSH